mmetsp:Transcript_27614/g.58775  ORF Transcript_27614/g.58775 Transcript_27614/m.58775 type:complete len:108 (+) Transcript_27614:647-970(+)
MTGRKSVKAPSATKEAEEDAEDEDEEDEEEEEEEDDDEVVLAAQRNGNPDMPIDEDASRAMAMSADSRNSLTRRLLTEPGKNPTGSVEKPEPSDMAMPTRPSLKFGC